MTSPGDFWSRRKAAVAAESESEAAARMALSADQQRADLEEKPDEEILAELGLKDPDTLEPGDDFAAFLRTAVPERLRRRALRRLWLSNPALANLDELVDYGEDFTDAATVVADLQTTYQVGKGMLKHVLEREAAVEPETKEELPPDAPAEVPEATPEPDTPIAVALPIEPAAAPAATARRRMRFDFDTDTRETPAA